MNMLVRTAITATLITGAGALPASAEDTIKVGVLVGYSGIGSLSGQQTDATIKLFQQ
ncbi:MAG: ABC transporter substrate-binding protein, partial [Xanthobacteraceae bacterium]|nr:ABC transporter substrate-binding protein [Xanthobacteraceae bacterium]